MRFLVDENLPIDVPELLERLGHDVVYLPQSGHRGTSDEQVWRLAASEGRIVVTRDLDFPLPDQPAPVGVILLRVPDTFTRRQIADVMAGFTASPTFDEVEGNVTVVSPGRVRARKL